MEANVDRLEKDMMKVKKGMGSNKSDMNSKIEKMESHIETVKEFLLDVRESILPNDGGNKGKMSIGQDLSPSFPPPLKEPLKTLLTWIKEILKEKGPWEVKEMRENSTVEISKTYINFN